MPRHQAAAFILQGRSDYNVLSGFNLELSRALNNMRIEPILVNLLDWQNSLSIINQALQDFGPQRIIAAFSFSGIGLELGNDSPDGNVWQHIKIPAISWMLDHPAYILKRHNLSTPATALLYTVPDFIHFQRNYIKSPQRISACRFGAFSGNQVAQQRELKGKDKPLIIFPKSVGNLLDIEQRWARLPTRMSRVLKDAVDHYWGDTPRFGDVVPSVLKAAEAAGLEIQNDLPLLAFFVALTDNYIRVKKGNTLLQELVKLPVQLYGNGIAQFESANNHATILPPMDYAAMVETFHKATALISMNPNNHYDCHDRVYHAWGCGALPVSDYNPWWAEQFPALSPYTYDFRDRSITAVVEKIVDDPNAATSLAWKAGQEVRAIRPVQLMATEAVEFALMHRYFTFNFVTPLDIYVHSVSEPPKP